jgi:hypothetical protein
VSIIDGTGDLFVVGITAAVLAVALGFTGTACYRWATSPTYQEQVCERAMYGESKGPGTCYDAIIERETGKILSLKIAKDTAK